jgi:hypothetical protein
MMAEWEPEFTEEDDEAEAVFSALPCEEKVRVIERRHQQEIEHLQQGHKNAQRHLIDQMSRWKRTLFPEMCAEYDRLYRMYERRLMAGLAAEKQVRELESEVAMLRREMGLKVTA